MLLWVQLLGNAGGIVFVPPTPIPPNRGESFVGGGNIGTHETYADENEVRDWERKQKLKREIKRDDDEIFLLLKIWTKLNG